MVIPFPEAKETKTVYATKKIVFVVKCVQLAHARRASKRVPANL